MAVGNLVILQPYLCTEEGGGDARFRLCLREKNQPKHNQLSRGIDLKPLAHSFFPISLFKNWLFQPWRKFFSKRAPIKCVILL